MLEVNHDFIMLEVGCEHKSNAILKAVIESTGFCIVCNWNLNVNVVQRLKHSPKPNNENHVFCVV